MREPSEVHVHSGAHRVQGDVEDVLLRAGRQPLLAVEIVRGVREQPDAAAESPFRLQVQAADVRIQSVRHGDDDRIRRAADC